LGACKVAQPRHLTRIGTTAVFGAVFCATGAALVVYILSGISLIGTALAVAIAAATLASLIWRSVPGRQAEFKAAIRAGIIAGVAATALYDLSRFVLIAVTGIRFWPFDIFGVFGRALFGNSFAEPFLRLAGLLYHVANGVGFAISYSIWLGHRGVLWGIAWALVLELCMISFYPGWLGMKAVDEFLQVSIFGHIVYGATLGWLARRLLVRKDGC